MECIFTSIYTLCELWVRLEKVPIYQSKSKDSSQGIQSYHWGHSVKKKLVYDLVKDILMQLITLKNTSRVEFLTYYHMILVLLDIVALTLLVSSCHMIFSALPSKPKSVK